MSDIAPPRQRAVVELPTTHVAPEPRDAGRVHLTLLRLILYTGSG
jgi:hypothetical protein